MYAPNCTLTKNLLCLVSILLFTASLFGCGAQPTSNPSPRYFNSLSNNLFGDSAACDNTSDKRDKLATTYVGIGPCYDTISISLFTSAASPAPTKTAIDLQPEGQQAFIEKLGGDEDIYSALATPFKRSPTNESGKDDSALMHKRKLTFSISTSRMAPADRIIEAHLIAKAPNGWDFVGWSGFETVRSDIKKATVTDALTNRLKASTGVASKVFQELANLSFEAERTRNYQAVSDLQFDVVEFLPRLTKRQAEFIISAPFPQVNVSGTYSVDVTLKYNEANRAMNIELAGKPTEMRIRPVQTAYIPENVTDEMDFELPYTVRRVIGDGQKTVAEDDDDAIYIYVDGAKSITGSAKIGKEIATGTQSLGVESKRTRVSAVTISSEVLLVEFSPDVLGIPTCLINLNGDSLTDLLRWMRADSSRIEMRDKDGKLIHRLIKLNGKQPTANELRNATITRYDITNFTEKYKDTCPVAFIN